MEQILDRDQLAEAKDLLAKMVSLYEEKADLEVKYKDLEDKVRGEVASACDIANKAGEPQPKKVKMPLLMAAIDDTFERSEKGNKFEIQVDEMDKYRSALTNKQVPHDLIRTFLNVKDEIDSFKTQFKEVVSDTALLSSDMLKAIEVIAKEQYQEIKNDKLAEAGFDVKPPKDNSDFSELKEAIKKLIGN